MSQQFETHPDCPDCFGTGAKHIQLIAARIPDPDGGDCENCSGAGTINLLVQAEEVIRRHNSDLKLNKYVVIMYLPVSVVFYLVLLDIYIRTNDIVAGVITSAFFVLFAFVMYWIYNNEKRKSKKQIIAQEIVNSAS